MVDYDEFDYGVVREISRILIGLKLINKEWALIPKYFIRTKDYVEAKTCIRYKASRRPKADRTYRGFSVYLKENFQSLMAKSGLSREELRDYARLVRRLDR